MADEVYRSNLGQWENPPTVQDEVIAYMTQMGSPLLLREIYRPLGIPKEHINRVLGRLHAKGFLKRWKIPVRSHVPGRHGEAAINDSSVRQCFLYAFSEAAMS